jgi:hypothetical protein
MSKNPPIGRKKRVRNPPVLPSQNDPDSESDVDDPRQSDPHYVPSSVVESSSEDDDRVEEVADESSQAGSQESQPTPADDDDDDDEDVVLVGV